MFRQNISLCFNGTRKEFEGYIRKRFDVHNQKPKSEGYFLRISGTDDSLRYFIFLEHFHWLIPEYGLLAHEVMHCVYDILKEIGMNLEEASVEAYCYYYQHIFQDCIYGIKEKLEKSDKR